MTQEDPFLGHVLGDRYRLTKRVGKGGFGAVFEAEHITLKRLFAIKILARQLELDPRFLKRFEHEARLTASLEHPHIVQVTDFGHDERVGSWFAMEYLRGEDLQARIEREGRLDNATAVTLMRQIVDAFAYAHKQGIIHRDVKSANVFLVTSQAVTDHVKVLDFGIARVLDVGDDRNDLHLTKTGAVMGSPAYMAPEQALNLKIDARTDIYALGIVLYEMVTGRVPFTATSALAVLTKHIKEAPAAPSEIAPEAEVNPYLELVILRCLQKKMDRRYQATEDLAKALEEAEVNIREGKATPSDLRETLLGLRTDMLADGSLLADSSEVDQRRIVAGRGYTTLQRQVLADNARAGRRVLALLAGLLVAAALLFGAWWMGARTVAPIPMPESTSTAGPEPAVPPVVAPKAPAPSPAPAVASPPPEPAPVPKPTDMQPEPPAPSEVEGKPAAVPPVVESPAPAPSVAPNVEPPVELPTLKKAAPKAPVQVRKKKAPSKSEPGGFLDDQKM